MTQGGIEIHVTRCVGKTVMSAQQLNVMVVEYWIVQMYLRGFLGQFSDAKYEFTGWWTDKG